jgi:Uma2 family endonuclease
MATQPKTYITPEQYLEIERKAEFKSEYYQGEMWPLGEPPVTASTKEAHSLIVWNLAAELHRQLRAKPCRAYMNDMRVRVNATGLYTYPDIAAVCGEPQFLDETRDTLLNPSLIVEVLSPSTEVYDRTCKFEHCRSVESVSEYLMLASERVSAVLYARQPDGRWLLTFAGHLEDSLDLQSVGAHLVLADLYEKVDLPAPPAAATS